MYDLIGDIHGHADELKHLLNKLGYKSSGNAFRHSERKVIFLGDCIDRGPKIRETLHIVREMVEQGNALALMGNHEYNAVTFHYKHPEGGHIRPHTIKNVLQHYQTMHQFKNQQRDYEGYIEWFKTLPLFIEMDDFNAVHACWDHDHIAFLKAVLNNGRLTDQVIYDAAVKGSVLYNAVEDTLKGKELRMPHGLGFVDKDGMERHDIRVRWWENPQLSTYRSYSVMEIPQLPDGSTASLSFTELTYAALITA